MVNAHSTLRCTHHTVGRTYCTLWLSTPPVVSSRRRQAWVCTRGRSCAHAYSSSWSAPRLSAARRPRCEALGCPHSQYCNSSSKLRLTIDGCFNQQMNILQAGFCKVCIVAMSTTTVVLVTILLATLVLDFWHL